MAYSEYRGRCVGRLMHFLYPMLNNADSRFEFSGDGKTVHDRFSSEPFATYEWIDDTDIPRFTFSEKDEHKLAHFIHSYNESVELDMRMNKILKREPYSHSKMLQAEEDEKKERSEKLKADIIQALKEDPDFFQKT